MDFLRSLILIPENPLYLKDLSDIDEFTRPEDIVKKKIRENPYNRDLIKRKLKKQKNTTETIIEEKPVKRKFTNRVVSKEILETVDSGEKNYIKNVTGSPIMVVTDEIAESGRNKGYPKAIQIREYICKSELTEKELNNANFLALYQQGKVVDVTHAEYKSGMKKVWEEKQKMLQIKEASIDENIVDPINPVRGSRSAGITRVSDRDPKDSIANKVARGEIYDDESENTIMISSAERGPSLEKELSLIESSDEDVEMSEEELRRFLGKV